MPWTAALAQPHSVHVYVDPGMGTDDVLSANKKQTNYKASLYSTEGSKDCEYSTAT